MLGEKEFSSLYQEKHFKNTLPGIIAFKLKLDIF